MKVKLNSARAGHILDSNGQMVGTFSQDKGEIVDMGEAEAQRHIKAGLASPVKDDPKSHR